MGNGRSAVFEQTFLTGAISCAALKTTVKPIIGNFVIERIPDPACPEQTERSGDDVRYSVSDEYWSLCKQVGRKRPF